MATLNLLITHLPGSDAAAQLELLRALAPESRFAVAYCGEEDEVARLAPEDWALVHDPSLTGPPRSFQSYTVLLEVVWEKKALDFDRGVASPVHVDDVITRHATGRAGGGDQRHAA